MACARSLASYDARSGDATLRTTPAIFFRNLISLRVQRLVDIARSLREAGRRHEQLDLQPEEAAFCDAIAGSADDVSADPKLAAIAKDLVKSTRADLTVDWADRESTEAAIRRKIKRLLHDHGYRPPITAGGEDSREGLNQYAQLVFEQAKALYRYWPEVEGRLFE